MMLNLVTWCQLGTFLLHMFDTLAALTVELSKLNLNIFQDKSIESYSNGLKRLGLSEDEQSENALLRSRIDEQSQLIMILKQRSDESLDTAKTLETRCSGLETQRQQLEQDLALAMKRCNMLDSRFNDLASNHQQMIEVSQTLIGYTCVKLTQRLRSRVNSCIISH